jgi:exopolysaccharide biosynthesis polyprenyl glycosylphosphotransferase
MRDDTIRGIRGSLILILDYCAIIAIFTGVCYLRLGKLPDYKSADLWIICTTFIFVLFFAGTYFRERSTKLPSLPIRTFLITTIAGAICIIWLYLLGPSKFTEYFGRGILPTATILSGIATTWIRFIINRLYHRQEQGAELLYLGYSESCAAFLSELKGHREVRSVTIATQSDVKADFDRYSLARTETNKLLLSSSWQSVIIDPSHPVSKEETASLVSMRLKGTPVLSLAEFYEQFWFMIPVHDIGDDWFLRSQGFSMLGSPIAMRVKRLIDLILSSVLLAITSPLVLFFGLLIKLTSKGPMFFTQTRVGLRGELFTIYKLRTMVKDAEDSGAQWATENDSRITLIGRFLRQTRIDELPQCWNVLKGNMSFVGPRPERPEFTKELTENIPYYDLRHLVKPGISGWAQVIFQYGASVEDSLKKLQYELYYIKNQSLLLDLNIMLRTLITVLQRGGR